MLNEKRVSFGKGSLNEILEKLKEFLNHLGNYTKEINNTHVRLYATGYFKILNR